MAACRERAGTATAPVWKRKTMPATSSPTAPLATTMGVPSRSARACTSSPPTMPPPMPKPLSAVKARRASRASNAADIRPQKRSETNVVKASTNRYSAMAGMRCPADSPDREPQGDDARPPR